MRRPRDTGLLPRVTVDPIFIVESVCAAAQVAPTVKDLSNELRQTGIQRAIQKRDTPKLFDWLIERFSYQGTSDAAVETFIARHGNVSYGDVATAIDRFDCRCPKLSSFTAYVACGYRKTAQTCAEPQFIGSCPVPSHDLRNGNLNRLAYSLYFFLRDVCHDDLTGFIDQTLEASDCAGHPDRLARMRAALLNRLRAIHSASDKILSMTFADLLIAGDPDRPRWKEVGASMIAVDSLVHAFLHRTAILHRLHSQHAYGPACYGKDGCASVIDRLARQIDARTYDPEFPAYFPRFIQYSIWTFCAQQGLDICNGNRIDDSARCRQQNCCLFSKCGRIPLRWTDGREPKARAPP